MRRVRARWRVALFGAAAAALTAPGVAAATTQTFTSSGTFTVPAGVTSLDVDVRGAAGGDNSDSEVAPGEGGDGGEAAGTVTVTPGDVLTVLVGGTGAANDGGNGGSGGPGGGGDGGGVGAGASGGAGGGGRSEVDLGSTELLVAGGGGGGAFFQGSGDRGGDGGGSTGLGADGSSVGGATQTSGGMVGPGDDLGFPGQKGQGGAGGGNDADQLGGGGGGGGFFGGGGGGASQFGDPGSYSAGGGGSGHIDASVTDGMMRTGVNTGSGLVTIGYTPAPTTSASAGAAAPSTGSGGAPPPGAPPLITAPTEPANAFDFARVRVGVQQLRLGFDYPGRGTLDVLVTTRKPGATSASLRPGGRRVTVGRLHDRAENPETHTLRVPITDRGKRILARRGKLPVRLSLVFTPDGGQSSRQARKFTVRPA